MPERARAADGCPIAWRRDGPRRDGRRDGAPALLLCNSIGTDHRLWEPQMAALAARFDVVRFDMRGHGASGAPPGDYALADLAGDAVAVLDAAGVARAHVCGLSLGGAVAQRLALDAPGRVERLVLACTAARIGTAEAWRARAEAVLGQGLASIAGMALERFFDAGFRAAHPEVVERFRATLLATPAQGYAGCCAALGAADLREEVRGIRAPTLAIAGTRDVSTPPADLRALAGLIPGAVYAELDAAHLANVEAPDAFARLLVDFLAGG